MKTVNSWREYKEDHPDFYTPEKLIPIAYAVVIRNESLDRVFPGGIERFCSRRGICNDQITVVNSMGGEEVDQIIGELIDAGLEFEKDIMVVDGFRIGMVSHFERQSHEPGSSYPYPLDSEWLECWVAPDGKPKVCFAEPSR